MEGKYIIVKYQGFELPILFHSIMEHKAFQAMLFSDEAIVSAGFFSICGRITQEDENAISVDVYGESTTLKKSHRKEDAKLIKKLLRN